MASGVDVVVPPGELMSLDGPSLVYLCNNDSLGEGKPNHMKNPNAFDRAIAETFAESVVVNGGAISETTFMVLSPSSRAWGTTELWLSSTLKALESLPTNSQQRVDIEARINELRATSATPTWEEAIAATLWDYNKGPLHTSFNSWRPDLVAVQGQHRAAALSAVYAPRLGLSISRAGDLGGGLFADAERTSKMDKLRRNLEKKKIVVNVYDFLTHDQAAEARQRTIRQTSTDGSFLDVATSLGMLVKQLYNPAADICLDRANEAFGHRWRKVLRKPSKRRKQMAIKKALLVRIDDTLTSQLGLKPQGKNSFAVCVFGFALCPERSSLRLLREYFQERQRSLVKAKAAKVKDATRAGKQANGESNGAGASVRELHRHAVTVSSMGTFFSLTSYSQNSRVVKDLLYEVGLSENFRSKCFYHFNVLEIVRAMCAGLVRRRNCMEDPHPYTAKERRTPVPTEVSNLYDLLATFVSVEEAAAVALEGEDFIHGMYEDVDFWVPHLVGLALNLQDPGPYLAGDFKVTKQALRPSLFRRGTAFVRGKESGVNPANVSNLHPGFGQQLHISTDGTEADFTARTWDDWFTYHNEERFKFEFQHMMMATFFGLLIVDRSLARLSSGKDIPDRLGKFRELVGAAPEEKGAGDLNEFLQNEEVVNGKFQRHGRRFFDNQRVQHLVDLVQASQAGTSKVSGHGGGGSAKGEGSSGADAPTGRSASSRTRTKYVAVSIVDDDDNKLHSLRVNKRDMEKLGFFDDDGVLKPGTFRCRFGEGATYAARKNNSKSTTADVDWRIPAKRQTPTAQPREEQGEATKTPPVTNASKKQRTANNGNTQGKGKEKSSSGPGGLSQTGSEEDLPLYPLKVSPKLDPA